VGVGQRVNDMLANMGNGWPETFEKIHGIKYYWHEGTGLTVPKIDHRRLANFSNVKWIGCEFGAFSKRSNHIPYDYIEAALAPMTGQYKAKVRSLHLDNPFSKRMVGWGDSLDEAAKYIAGFCKHVQDNYQYAPGKPIHIALTTSFPNWHWSPQLLCAPGMFTAGNEQSTGVYLSQLIPAFVDGLNRVGVRLAAVEIDCPWDYYKNRRETYRRIYHEAHKFCMVNDIKYHLICNAVANLPGEGVKFQAESLEYLKAIQEDGARQDYPFRFDSILCQSWYAYPSRVIPETLDNTLTNTALKMARNL
jgi:hypothetical protein